VKVSIPIQCLQTRVKTNVNRTIGRHQEMEIANPNLHHFRVYQPFASSVHLVVAA
jgi:hypothetical protein